MNSAQGGWGIQDRHDRVISWLSAVVVSLLVLYGLIYVTSSGRPPQGPLGLRPTPLPSPTSDGPIPPATYTAPPTRRPRPTPAPLPPVATPGPTRTASLPTSDVVRPVASLPGMVPGLGFPAATPTPPVPTDPATSPGPLPPATPSGPGPATSVPVATRVAPATQVPSPTPPAPTRAPAPGGRPVYLRVGSPFQSGAEALGFAMRHDLPSFRLEPAPGGSGALVLEVGPYASESDALEASPGLRSKLRDPSIPVVLRRGDEPSAPMGAGAEPTPSPTADATIPAGPPTSEPPTPRASRPPRPTRAPRPTPAPVPTTPIEPSPGTAPGEIRVFGRAGRGDSDTPAVAEAQRRLAEVHGLSPRTEAGYSVQVAAFQEATNAVNFRKHLAAKGYDSFVDVVEAGGVAWYRVMIGSFPGATPARQEAERFLGQHPTGYQVFVRLR